MPVATSTAVGSAENSLSGSVPMPRDGHRKLTREQAPMRFDAHEIAIPLDQDGPALTESGVKNSQYCESPTRAQVPDSAGPEFSAGRSLRASAGRLWSPNTRLNASTRGSSMK